MLQKSSVAIELDGLLDDWKSRLPEWLDFSSVSFREPEWAAKQKLVLNLRYLNARILLHRPFLTPSASRGGVQTQRHVSLCLEAARETIRLLYDSYANKHYFRTWWYNSTYTLYAGMIILYVVMLKNTAVPSSELLEDVKKSRDILHSMEEASVARRSADLMTEVLEVAQAYVQQRQETDMSGPPEVGTVIDLPTPNEMSNIGAEFPRTLLPYADGGQYPGILLASLIDPNLLQDFTANDNNFAASLDFGMFPYPATEGSLDGQTPFFGTSTTSWEYETGIGNNSAVFQ